MKRRYGRYHLPSRSMAPMTFALNGKPRSLTCALADRSGYRAGILSKI